MSANEKDNLPKATPPSDPDLNPDDFEIVDNFDDPFPTTRPKPNVLPGRGGLENGLGTFFKGLNEVTGFITELAEKTEQAAQRAAERRRAASGEFRPQTNDKGFAARWGINPNLFSGGSNPPPPPSPPPSYTNPPLSPFARPFAPPPPVAAEPDASVREPYMEMHDEAAEGVIVVIAELPGVEEENLEVEIQDDVLIVRGLTSDYRFEKECLLPAIVQSQPQSRHYQNGLLELRLKKK